MQTTNVPTRFLLAATLGLFASAAPAHDSWMAVASFGDRGAVVAVTTGDSFPRHDYAVSLERIERAEIVEAAGNVAMWPMRPDEKALKLRAIPRTRDVIVAIASVRASEITLDDADVDVYVAGELGGDAALLARHRELGQWRERYRKHLKLIARRSGEQADARTTRPHGLPYELVPSIDPTSPDADDGFEVCAHAANATVDRAYIGLVESDGTATWQWSDANGCVRVAPRSRDGYLLRSIRIRPIDDDAAIDWDSDFASLTVYRLDEARASSDSPTPLRGSAHAH